MHEKNYGFDEGLNIFDEIENKCSKLYKQKPRTPNKIDIKKYSAQILENYGR